LHNQRRCHNTSLDKTGCIRKQESTAKIKEKTKVDTNTRRKLDSAFTVPTELTYLFARLKDTAMHIGSDSWRWRPVDFETFKTKRETEIIPALEEIAAYLAEKGQPAHVVTPADNIRVAEIALFAPGTAAPDRFPRFLCIYETNGMVRFYAHERQHSQPAGQSQQVRHVTGQWVQEQFADWFASRNAAPTIPPARRDLHLT